MTYCVGILLENGLVFAADSRTNAGVDHVMTFRKLTTFEAPGDRVMVLMSAGNLATTQAVVTLVSERLDERTEEHSLYHATSMFQAARLVGNALREVIDTDGEYVREVGADPSASFILGGQIAGRPPRLFQIYPAGNFVEATPDTPYFQIGEIKYGKPILDRVTEYQMSLKRAVKGALVSFDSTMRSNVSVGLPIDVVVYRRDALKIEERVVIEPENTYFRILRENYSSGIMTMFDGLPDPTIGE